MRMRYRRFGKHDVSVSEIGYGTWGVGGAGWIGAEEAESRRALHRAIDLGVTFIDTARMYGDAEQLIGKVLGRRAGHKVLVASKVPPRNMVWPAPLGVPATETFPGDHIREQTETTLRNLGTDTLDVQQFHVWQDEWLGQGDWAETIAALKQEGKIRFFGVSINDHEPESVIELVKSGLVDAVQLIYNIFDQSPEDELLDLCRTQGVAVVVRVPLDEGGLTGRVHAGTTFPDGDYREQYFQGGRKAEVGRRVDAIRADLGLGEDEIAALALRFTLSHDAVTTVIPGMRSVRNVDRNVAVSDGRALSAEQLDKLRAHRWIRNFYKPDPA